MNSNDSITQVTLKPGYDLVQRKTSRDPSYLRVGKKSSKGIKMDLIDIVAKSSAKEKDIILYIKDHIEYDPYEKEYYPVVRWKPTELGYTSNQVRELSRAMKKLRDKKIVAKVKPYSYMINPDLLMPSNYSKWLKVWEDTVDA